MMSHSAQTVDGMVGEYKIPAEDRSYNPDFEEQRCSLTNRDCNREVDRDVFLCAPGTFAKPENTLSPITQTVAGETGVTLISIEPGIPIKLISIIRGISTTRFALE